MRTNLPADQLTPLEALEPRLLLSASTLQPIQDQQDFAEYLDSVGLGGLEQLDVSLTLDVPDGMVSASAPEQVAAMTAAGLNANGAQPVGVLTGKIVYVHGGHGLTADNLGSGSWSYQRPEIEEIVEDLSNQDMMSFLVEFLWNAGATVVPLRPVGHQLNEVVLDNDDTEVTFVGSWNNSSSTVFYGSPGDTPYRWTNTSSSETAYARYRPNIPEDGFYPVYSWTRAGSDRVDQLYRVTHSGGTTEVSVNHQRVGNGLVYLGTYYFEQGADGYVDISNENSQSGVVIADMIRFGNGVGDIDRGGGVSGTSRENEPALYWIQAHLGQGVSSSEYRTSSSDRSATVSASPRWAEYMNRESDGSLSDRVFVSFHSNAGSGANRGVLGLYNGNNRPGSATPNQFLLADLLASEINDDMVALNGTFEHNWFNRNNPTLDRSDIEFGEINNEVINNEFDATIVEWAFHDNSQDLDLMRDADVRNVVARSTYQGLVRYFNNVDSGATPVSFLPDPVTDVSAETNGDGTVTISWTPPAFSAIGGGTPTGYMIYGSLNGYGFDGGTYVAGGGATSHTMTGLDSANGTHYFKVVAVNAAGESLGSQVVAATPLPSVPASKVLIVNGFDRIDKNTNDREGQPNGWVVDRVRLRGQNSGDYAVQVAEAIEAFNPALGIDTAQNESIIAGDILLGDYDTVVWILGNESTADDTFNTTEQTLVTNFINGGGDLFVSGAEIGWDLEASGNGQSFFNNTLRGDYVSDDAGTYNVAGVGGSIFDGLSFGFDDGTIFYDAQFPDVINPTAGATSALSYVGGTGGSAAIQKKGSTDGDVVMFGFPFEIITDASDREDVMAAVLTFFGAPASEVPAPPLGLVATPGNNTIDLDWMDNAEPDLLGYNILRAASPGGPYTQLNVSTILVSQYTDNTALNGTTYYYQAEAIDTDLNVSVPSPEVEATPDDHGNDKDDATVIALPSTTDGQIGPSDADWFELSLTAGTDYTFTVLDDGLANAGIRLYTASGSTLLASDDGPASGSTLAQIQYAITFSDTYFVEVVGNGGATGDYDLAVQQTDDHGNDTGSATDLAGAFSLGTIEIGGDVDFFRVPVLNGMTYTFGVTDAGVPDAILTLYNGTGAFISQDVGSSPGGTHAQLVHTASADGFVYVSVAAQPASIGGYFITVDESTQIPGDLDGDGFVGLSDLDIILNNWNLNVPPGDPLADPTGDNFVGLADLDIVLNNWNAGTPPAAASEATASEQEAVAPAAAQAQAPASTGPATQPVAQEQSSHQRRQQQQQQQQRDQAPVNQSSSHGLAITNWHTRARSAFDQGNDDGFTPAIGLWENNES